MRAAQKSPFPFASSLVRPKRGGGAGAVFSFGTPSLKEQKLLVSLQQQQRGLCSLSSSSSAAPSRRLLSPVSATRFRRAFLSNPLSTNLRYYYRGTTKSQQDAAVSAAAAEEMTANQKAVKIDEPDPSVRHYHQHLAAFTQKLIRTSRLGYGWLSPSISEDSDEFYHWWDEEKCPERRTRVPILSFAPDKLARELVIDWNSRTMSFYEKDLVHGLDQERHIQIPPDWLAAFKSVKWPKFSKAAVEGSQEMKLLHTLPAGLDLYQIWTETREFTRTMRQASEADYWEEDELDEGEDYEDGEEGEQDWEDEDRGAVAAKEEAAKITKRLSGLKFFGDEEEEDEDEESDDEEEEEDDDDYGVQRKR
ncbi:Pescadillo [Balamuthia mandrillaris]